MGKKHKKSRRYYDDDLLLGPPPSVEQDEAPDGVGEAADVDGAPEPVAARDAAAEDEDAPTSKPQTKSETKEKRGGTKQQKKAVNIDLIRLEETMTTILRHYGDKPEDWLYRTFEKELKLPKHALRNTLEPHILDEMMDRVERKLEREYDDEMDRQKRWDGLVAELSGKAVLMAEDKERLRLGASKVGLDPDAAVATVMETMEARAAKEVPPEEGDAGDLEEDELLEGAAAPMGLSVLLALQPFLLPPSSHSPSLVKPFMAVRQFLCALLYNMLCVILGARARGRANKAWEKVYLPSIEAEEVARETEEDRRMVLGDAHLWSNEQGCWIEKGGVYRPPSVDDASHKNAPPTVRWNGTKKQWERWSKNLTTKTKALKAAAATGRSMSFTRGTFVPIRAGEGWATSPDQPEVVNEQLDTGCIRFLACLPTENRHPEVVDVTAWAIKSILSKDAARELDAVDSGRELFSFDVSSLVGADKKKGVGKKGKGGTKSKKKKHATSAKDAGDEGEESITVERKGIGCTAQINKRYMDKL